MPGLLAGVQQEGETSNAVLACNDWLRMGPGRSFAVLNQRYNDMPRSQSPTQSLDTLHRWSSNNDWARRAQLFDQRWDDIKTEAYQQEMETGLALANERVRKLKRLAHVLEGQMYERGPVDETGERPFVNLWLTEHKMTGPGRDAQLVVSKRRFNAALVAQYLATLNDLARETGGRTTTHDHSISGRLDSAPLVTPEGYTDSLAKLVETLGAVLPSGGNGRDGAMGAS